MWTAIVNIGQLVTMAGPPGPRIGPALNEIGIIPDGVLLVEDGRVREAGRRSDLDVPKDFEVIDAEGGVVTPGFVDAHTHAVFAGNRANEFEQRSLGKTYQEIKQEGGGIQSTVAATNSASEEELLSCGQRHLRWMLAHGTTCVEVKSGYGLTAESELRILRTARNLGPQHVRTTFLGAHAVPAGRSKSEYLDELISVSRDVEHLADFVDIFVESGYFDEADARILFESINLPRKMHVDQFSNRGGARLASELDAVTADHLEYTDLDGIRALKASSVAPVLLPTSVFGLGLSKYPDARTMISEGLPVVLATDFNPGSSPCPSLPFVMSVACSLMKMTPAEALSAATINGAYALQMGSSVGSLESGKSADFVIHDVQDYREIPYWIGHSTVRETWIAGVRHV